MTRCQLEPVLEVLSFSFSFLDLNEREIHAKLSFFVVVSLVLCSLAYIYLLVVTEERHAFILYHLFNVFVRYFNFGTTPVF